MFGQSHRIPEKKLKTGVRGLVQQALAEEKQGNSDEDIDKKSTITSGDSDEESLVEIILPVAGASESDDLEPPKFVHRSVNGNQIREFKISNICKQCACPNVCDEKEGTSVLDAGPDATAPEQATSLEQFMA